jgi:hypothetical protein
MGWGKKKKGSEGGGGMWLRWSYRGWEGKVEKVGELPSPENGNDSWFRGDRSGMEVNVVWVSLLSRKCEIVWRFREEDFETNERVSELHRKISVESCVKAQGRIWAQIDPQVAGSNQMNPGEAELTALVDYWKADIFGLKRVYLITLYLHLPT